MGHIIPVSRSANESGCGPERVDAACQYLATDGFEFLLSRLQRVRRINEHEAVASCPSFGHGKGRGDVNPSLSISTGNGSGPLINCFAGCDTDAVLKAVGLEWQDILPPREDSVCKTSPIKGSRPITVVDLAADKTLPLDFLTSLGWEDRPDGVFIPLKPIAWLWRDRLPLGKLVVIAGEPGLGKRRLALSIAATTSKEGSWHGGEGRCERGEVLILNFEDDPAGTTVPRLTAEGADLSAIHQLIAVPDEKGRRAFNLRRDTDRLAKYLELHPLMRLVPECAEGGNGKHPGLSGEERPPERYPGQPERGLRTLRGPPHSRSRAPPHLRVADGHGGGADPFAIMKAMGHTDIKTTMIYVSLGKSHIRDQVEKLNAIRLIPPSTPGMKALPALVRAN